MFSKQFREMERETPKYPAALSMGDFWNLNKERIDDHFRALSMASKTTGAATATSYTTEQMEPLPQNGELEAEDGDFDSAYGGGQSDRTSVTSSLYRGIWENGRRYQAYKEGDYWQPADEQQFDSMAKTHLTNLIFDNQEENDLFRSPLDTQKACNILDIGCGEASWAIDVADRYPNFTVTGVDLFPPPQTWVPPNCLLEVDDATKIPWTFGHKFDLIHLRWMVASFSREDYNRIYAEAYRNLNPGGWIEHAEIDIVNHSDDGSLSPDSVLAEWGPLFLAIGEKAGRPLDTPDTMRQAIEDVGFVNVHERRRKLPIGPWCKHFLLKEAGRLRLEEYKAGLEGYTIFLLTHYGIPEPWTKPQVDAFLDRMRRELDNPKNHIYSYVNRVWAQKPLDAKDDE